MMVLIRVNSYLECHEMTDYVDVAIQKTISCDNPDVVKDDDLTIITWKEGDKYIELWLNDEELARIIKEVEE